MRNINQPCEERQRIALVDHRESNILSPESPFSLWRSDTTPRCGSRKLKHKEMRGDNAGKESECELAACPVAQFKGPSPPL